jgi:hypothetical protein
LSPKVLGIPYLFYFPVKKNFLFEVMLLTSHPVQNYSDSSVQIIGHPDRSASQGTLDFGGRNRFVPWPDQPDADIHSLRLNTGKFTTHYYGELFF